MHDLKGELKQLLLEFDGQHAWKRGDLFVVGCSTSEVAGKKIGTDGSAEIAKEIYDALIAYADWHQIHLAFQGCEHINRALTIEREAAQAYRLEPVSVIPVRSAGGAMSEHAYGRMQDPVVVEALQAHAGIDIGQTLIGMHLKPVAIPVRTSIAKIGEAIAACARTRPKLIGGARAVYAERIPN